MFDPPKAAAASRTPRSNAHAANLRETAIASSSPSRSIEAKIAILRIDRHLRETDQILTPSAC